MTRSEAPGAGLGQRVAARRGRGRGEKWPQVLNGVPDDARFVARIRTESSIEPRVFAAEEQPQQIGEDLARVRSLALANRSKRVRLAMPEHCNQIAGVRNAPCNGGLRHEARRLHGGDRKVAGQDRAIHSPFQQRAFGRRDAFVAALEHSHHERERFE